VYCVNNESLYFYRFPFKGRYEFLTDMEELKQDMRIWNKLDYNLRALKKPRISPGFYAIVLQLLNHLTVYVGRPCRMIII